MLSNRRTLTQNSDQAGTAQRGVALLIVITILVTMVLVAVPFALSMRQGQERTRSIAARGRADFEASLLAEITKSFLSQGHPDQEQKRFDRGERGAGADPKVDTLDEMTPNESFRKKLEEEILDQWARDSTMAGHAQYLQSRGLGPLNDDRGSIWTVQVQDAQALVNVNGASPFLLGNLLGSALLSDDLDTGSGDIAVANVVTGRYGGLRGFPAKDSYLRVGREVVHYEEFDGEIFRGCTRGVLQDTPLEDNGGAESHEKGTPVIDYTAYKLATHLIARNPGSLTPFRNLEALRDIASWGVGGVITADRLERLLPYLTVWSRRETSGGWKAAQLVINQLPQSLDSGEPDEVQLRDFVQNPAGTTAYFNPGTLARITNGIDTVYQSVERIGDSGGRRRDAFLALSGPVNAAMGEITFAGGETTISAFAPYPININTASREVLYAVMANVQFWRSDSKDNIVTPELAWQLAGEIEIARKGALRVDTENGRRIGGPFRSGEDFGRFLEAKVKSSEITRAHFAALYTNAVNPHSWRLRFGTAPWCFRTLDVYHLEARVALNNRAGEQIAEAGVREVVEIGSDSTASWVLDSQQDFEQRIAMGSGAKWITTYPFGVAYKNRAWQHIQPALRAPKGYAFNVYPSITRNDGKGDVRLEPARLDLPGTQYVDHFDGAVYADGHFTFYDGAYTKPVNQMFMRKGDKHMRPFSMSFWWRPYSDADWTAFDAGMDQYENRVAVFVQQGDDGQELTFRVCAGNRWAQGAEVYVPLAQLDFEPGNWYHIHVSCAGEDPSTMQMLVDGVDIGRRRGLSTTSGSITADGQDIPVESTRGFPIRGAIRIGTEIIEYQTRTGSSFRDCLRGTRGTVGQEWPSNTPVHMVGYSMPLTVPIMRGGSSMVSALDHWNAVRIKGLRDENSSVTEVPPIEIDYTDNDGTAQTFNWILAGFDPDLESIQVEAVDLWDESNLDAFGTRGVALMGSWRVVKDLNPDNKLGGWELVSYERDGNTFTIERYWHLDGNGGNGSRFWDESDAPRHWLLTEDVSRKNLDGQDHPICATLLPISVQGSGSGAEGDDYLDPANPEHEELLKRYYAEEGSNVGRRSWTARVCISSDDQSQNDFQEVFSYDTIDRRSAGQDLLFVADSPEHIQTMISVFYGNRVDNPDPPGSGGPPPTEPPPVPPVPDPTPPPVPPTPDPGPTPPPSDEPADPTPGDGVPPGVRDPSDPEPTPDPDPDPGDPDPGDPDSGEPGTGEPGGGTGDPDSGDDGGADGGETGEDDEPTDPGSDDPGDAGDQTDEGGGREGDSESGEGSTDGAPPPEEEPSPDDSGGGGDYGSPDGEGEAGGDSLVPNVPKRASNEDLSDTEATDDPPWEAGILIGYPVKPGTDSDPDNGPPEGLGLQTARTYARLFRGRNRTMMLRHSGSPSEDSGLLLPCFRTYEWSRGRRRPNELRLPVQGVGRNDVITIHTGVEGTDRLQVGVRWGSPGTSWAALNEFVDKRYDPDSAGATVTRSDYRGRARILKFPCGELPDEMSQDIEFGQSRISGSSLVTAFLDELHVWRHTLDTQMVVEDLDGVLEDAEEIRLITAGPDQLSNTLDGYDQDCGLALIEGELVIYRGSRQEGEHILVLERVARGQLGTKATFHPRGGFTRFIPDIPVSYLDGGMTSEASSLPMGRVRGWPREGLARILQADTAELVHYTRRGENELLMPVSIDADEDTRDRGLFRGRFGTDAIDHDSNEIVVFQPFRYWDRFAARRSKDDDSFSGVHDHPETSYFEFGKKVRAGYWRGFTWSQNLAGRNTGQTGGLADDTTGEASGLLDIYVMARFNPNVPWDSKQVVDLRAAESYGTKRDLSKQMTDSLFLFDSTGEANLGNGIVGNRLGLEADTAEFRVYMVYKANAFDPVDAARSGVNAGDDPILVNWWKQTPWMESFSLNYFSRTATRYRAVVR